MNMYICHYSVWLDPFYETDYDKQRPHCLQAETVY